ncbi:DOPA 4,5-dioxygenase family protein [Phenylobacterium montanum]|uniref:Aromatic ring-opening dioxygenase n=1 Tax=Phenylobacterium montanum TaxID=2823693 RepID=A0A975FZV3_9CAUL|nr:DOPA 4,5-dioxygenase family protein [Caulobacter sp. S6]QUD87386.1 hypothetical protein KCG34_20395 [Caulobacter sp. S6]
MDQAAPYHAHIYYVDDQRDAALALRETLRGFGGEGGRALVLMAGALRDGPVGPHPISQFEIHFLARDLGAIRPVLEASGLKVLVHPLTHDDLADHTTLGDWIGQPLALDVSVLDPPGENKGLARFGVEDF